ncbi:lysophospholipase [Candidatus Uabimicrobium sp. HlEnr_7]|uniref:alpha/beta hydrolase n=1 Tax=Candidatus Uabimicrobium helgolandensis TaxID=3095367 RepID=UPI003558AC08
MGMSNQSVLYCEGFFPSENRWLFYRYWQQNSDAKGDIIGIHGALDHSGRYKKIGKSLAEKGYNFYVFDLAGYGRSEGKRGFVNQLEDYLVDVGNFYAFLREFKDMKNPFILGHNMGALLAILFTQLGQCFVKGNILCSPLFHMKNQPSIWKKVMAKFSNIALPKFAVDYKIDVENLSNDPNVGHEYSLDPFIHEKVTARWLCELYKTMKQVQSKKYMIQTPTLIMQGDGDTTSDVAATKSFFAGLRCKKEFFLIRHAKHEILNEIANDKIIGKMLAWTEDNL